ncbi:hypothetical protein JT359_02560, partial [Candidatus Poribacteria bacterium]|nr:hypothetical protein [Candidatus Poribacteria bacterium]
MFFVEPSAGTGTFFDLLPVSNRLGIDINPKRKDILSKDFLTITELGNDPDQTVIIGNPPFGKRAKMGIAFFNHGANLGDIIEFIVPVNFRKYLVHKQLNESMRLISKMELPRDAFYLESGSSYSVNTEFQIWTRLPSEHSDMRQYASLPIRHKDFQLWQYNNTVA